LRIIAGKYKAKKILGPKTEKTRPTLDRVKEALFSILSPYLEDARVLDLFSGTGNLAIESISRGAEFAWMNDIETLSISIIKSNTELTNSSKYVKITKKDYIKSLNQILDEGELFDIIFLDPPYDTKYGIKSLEYISNTNDKILSKNGIIVYETDKNFMSKIQKTDEGILDSFENLECIDERNYGNVVLRMYKWRK
jgi:16S rRNA (guanine966-N2)-methyltransferase